MVANNLRRALAISLSAVMIALIPGSPVDEGRAQFTFCGPVGPHPSGEYLDEGTWEIYDYNQQTDCLAYDRDWDGDPAEDGPEVLVGDATYTTSGTCSYSGAAWYDEGVYDTFGHCVGAGLEDIGTALLMVRRYDTRLVMGAGDVAQWWGQTRYCDSWNGDWDTPCAPDTIVPSEAPCVSQTVSLCGGVVYKVPLVADGLYCSFSVLWMEPAFGSPQVYDQTEVICRGFG